MKPLMVGASDGVAASSGAGSLTVSGGGSGGGGAPTGSSVWARAGVDSSSSSAVETIVVLSMGRSVLLRGGAVSIAAGLLRLVERAVRQRDQLLRLCRGIRHERGRSQADRHAAGCLGARVGYGELLDRAAHRLGHLRRTGRRRAGQQDDELLAAVARHQIAGA